MHYRGGRHAAPAVYPASEQRDSCLQIHRERWLLLDSLSGLPGPDSGGGTHSSPPAVNLLIGTSARSVSSVRSAVDTRRSILGRYGARTKLFRSSQFTRAFRQLTGRRLLRIGRNFSA